MHRIALLFFLSLGTFACDDRSSSSSLTISLAQVNADITPVTNNGYIVKNIPFGPIEKLARDLKEIYNITLKNRGEAHITVISPPEYTAIKEYISMEELNHRGLEHLRTAKFTIDCVGRGELKINDKLEQTYFVVVTSEDLLKFRREIYADVKAKGFDGMSFDPERYHPHITIGFTARDLHREEGVNKDHSSCHLDLKKI